MTVNGDDCNNNGNDCNNNGDDCNNNGDDCNNNGDDCNNNGDDGATRDNNNNVNGKRCLKDAIKARVGNMPRQASPLKKKDNSSGVN
jgi:hypothetical protein